jgi:thioester reductase-like protein
MNIKDYYWNKKTIALTGGTTFLGTVLLERIFRTLPNISKIILVVFSSQNNEKNKNVKDKLFGTRFNFDSVYSFKNELFQKVH